LKQIYAIAAGGAIGALLRYWISMIIFANVGRSFPWGTLVVNIIGSFLIGFLSIFFIDKLAITSEWKNFWLIGLLGAFTTFSAFSLETVNLIERADYLSASMNVLANVFACILAAIFGIVIAKQIG
tara:strand:- start:3092 stop:3469 length:378 start_codon:yes stop_codon:yes gene_type:complete